MNLLGIADQSENFGLLAAHQLKAGTRKLIEYILNSNEKLSEVVDRSYYHSNGFKKVVLFHAGKQHGEIRLHEWLPSEGIASDRHNHPWNFVSIVLDGVLENQTFEEHDGIDFQRTLIAPTGNDGDGYLFIPDGLAALTLVSATSLCAGGGYAMRRQLIHNAFSKSGALTLMVQGPFKRETTFGFREAGIPKRKERIERISQPEIVSMLERANHLLTFAVDSQRL